MVIKAGNHLGAANGLASPQISPSFLGVVVRSPFRWSASVEPVQDRICHRLWFLVMQPVVRPFDLNAGQIGGKILQP